MADSGALAHGTKPIPAARLLQDACEELAALLQASHVSVCITGVHGPAIVAQAAGQDVDPLALHTHETEPVGGSRVRLANENEAQASLVVMGARIALNANPLTRAALEKLQLLTRLLSFESAAKERDDLARADAAIVLAARDSRSLEELPDRLAAVVLDAIPGDAASVFIAPVDPGELLGDMAPAVSHQSWARLRTAIRMPGNEALYEEVEAQPYQRRDFDDGRPLTPVETWARDELRMRSLVVNRSASGGDLRTAVISVAAAQPTIWSPRETAFLQRAVEIARLSAERLRGDAIAARLQERTEAQAALLDSLGAQQPLQEIASTFVSELHLRYNARCLAIARAATLPGESVVLYAARGIDPAAVETAIAGADAPPPGLEHAVEVPIRDESDLHGRAWIDLEDDQPSPKLMEEMEAALRPLAVLIEHSHTLSRLENERRTLVMQTERMQAVLGLLAALGPEETVQEVADPVANAIRHMYGADHCSIVLIEEGGRPVLRGLDSTVPDVSSLAEAVAEHAYLDRLAERGYDLLPDIVPLAGDVPLLAALTNHGMRSVLRVRIGPLEAPAGIIGLAARGPGAFDDAAALELCELARPLAVAVAYFAGRREAMRRARALERLSLAGTAAGLAAAFLGECHSLFGVSHGAILRFEGDTGGAVCLACDGLPMAEEALPIGVPLETVRRSPAPVRLRSDMVGLPGGAELRALGIEHGVSAPLIADGAVVGAIVLWRGGPVPATNAELLLLGTITKPLTVALERAIATNALRESELKYRSLIAQADEMIFLFDRETLDILEMNDYGARILGYTEAEARTLKLTHLVDDNPANISRLVRRAADEGELRLVDRPYRRHDGTIITMDVVASAISVGGRQTVLVLARDVSERRIVERRLIQGQKMEALGTLAGNVAHDFNNLLTTILGFASLLKRTPEMTDESREHLGLIEDAARRAADLAGRLLSFARGGLVRFGPVDLGATIDETLRLAETALPQAIVIKKRLPPAHVIVEGDAGQLQQALLNIILNARDAMPDGGTLTIRLRPAGDSCILSITDTGSGMSEEERLRLFEPFFTTKAPGSGTGLGMSITYGIVQGHHGTIAVTTAPGRGTTFTITLPLLDLDAIEEPAASSTADGEASSTVLVVDDDDLVRRTVCAMLRELGYNAVPANGGRTAVEILDEAPGRFAAVLLDLVMPGMSGLATFHALREVRPGLPILICTGYADDDHLDAPLQREAAAIIHKPFTPERLDHALEGAGALPNR